MRNDNALITNHQPVEKPKSQSKCLIIVKGKTSGNILVNHIAMRHGPKKYLFMSSFILTLCLCTNICLFSLIFFLTLWHRICWILMKVRPFSADILSGRCDDNDNDNIMTQNILMVARYHCQARAQISTFVNSGFFFSFMTSNKHYTANFLTGLRQKIR